MHERIFFRIGFGWPTGVALMLAAPGCLDRNAGQDDPSGATTIASSTTGITGTTGTTGTTGDDATTFPGIMTTTVDTGHGDSDTGEPDPCGNGKIDPPEQCDQGEANADDGECTRACRWNVCGDGLAHEGDEFCDDGPDNGKYGHCNDHCDGLAERCGDGDLQAEEGELCDDDNPHYGCLKECTWATSCLNVKASWGDQADSGLYVIRRMSVNLTVWCDMEADGGGYTFLKYASGADPNPKDREFEFAPEPLSGLQAEQKCGYWGLRLFSPRTEAHLAAAVIASGRQEFAPIQKGKPFPPTPLIDSDVHGYLAIMGIYPVTPGTSCVGQPLNSDDCPQWAAKPDPLDPDRLIPFWVSDVGLPGEPSKINCDTCSLSYTWDSNVDPPVLVDYSAFAGGGTSSHFLCEIGDKLGP